jgi:hypothetical protein
VFATGVINIMSAVAETVIDGEVVALRTAARPSMHSRISELPPTRVARDLPPLAPACGRIVVGEFPAEQGFHGLRVGRKQVTRSADGEVLHGQAFLSFCMS